MPELSKHEAGAPLSDAEIQQRKDAARARWAATGTAVGAAGSAAATIAATRKFRATLRDALQPVVEAHKTGWRHDDLNAQAADRVKRGLGGKGFLSTAAGLHRRAARRFDAQASEALASGATDVRHLDDLAVHHEGVARDLEERGRDPRRVKVKGADEHSVDIFARSRAAGNPQVQWSHDAHHRFAEAKLRGAFPGAASLDDLAAHIHDPKANPAVAADMRRWNIRGESFKAKHDEVVQGHTRAGQDHTRRIDGYPNRVTRNQMRASLRDQVDAARARWQAKATGAAQQRIDLARLRASPAGAKALGQLKFLRSTPVRLAALGAGALAGGVAGYFGYKALGKSNDEARDANGRWTRAAGIVAGATGAVAAALAARWGVRRVQTSALRSALQAVRSGASAESAHVHVPGIGRVQFHEGKGGAGVSHIRSRRAEKQGMSEGRVNDLLDRVPSILRYGKTEPLPGFRIPGQEQMAVNYGQHRVVLRRPTGREDKPWRMVSAYPTDPKSAAQAKAWGKARGAAKKDGLNKSAPDDGSLPPDPETPTYEAGASIESDLSTRVARALKGWKDDVAERLGQPRGATLHQTMLTDLDRAMRPLDDALQGGAEAGLAFTTKARSPLPEAFVQGYRLDRVREIADDQRDAIKQVLLSAAKDGASPDEMARRVRQTVGLTAHQAGLVLNYRRSLETLHPSALTRALRDRRYDGTVTKAIEGKKALATPQVDRMTDAYHRRFLAHRAMTIARTEGLRAANNGHIAGVEMMLDEHPGFQVVKTWMATEDDKTRPDHRELNGKSVVGLETPFVCDDGRTIRWPHDPDADADMVCGCRCTVATQLVPIRTRMKEIQDA